MNIHIIFAGGEITRALYGLVRLPVDRVYLLEVESKSKYLENLKNDMSDIEKMNEIIIKRIQNMGFKQQIIEKTFDPTVFTDAKRVLEEILEELRIENREDKIYINIASLVDISLVAFCTVILNYENVQLYYVKPKEFSVVHCGIEKIILPTEAMDIDLIKPLLHYYYRSLQPNSLTPFEWSVIEAISNKDIKCLNDLCKIIWNVSGSKRCKSNLSYYCRKLEKMGLINYKRGIRIELTEKGRNLLREWNYKN